MNYSLLRTYCFFILLLPLFSDAQNFHTESFNVDNGLPQSQINVMLTDSRGFMWFGTAGGGAAMYDGQYFKCFTEKDGLAGPIVNDIAEDTDGNIWIASSWGGLSKYDGKNFKIYGKSKGLEGGAFTSLACDSNGTIWVGGKSGLYYLSDNKFISCNTGTEQFNFEINDIFVDYNSTVWVVTSIGLFFVNEKHQPIPFTSTVQGIKSVVKDKSGKLWIAGMNLGLFKISGNKNEVIVVNQFSNIKVNKLFLDKDTNVWIATLGHGVYKFIESSNKFELFNNNETDNVISIAKDREGDIWFGTNGSGAVKYTGKAFTYFDFQDGLNQGDIFSVMSDRDSNVWVGSAGKGIFKFDGKKSVHYSLSESNNANRVRQIYQDSSGRIWACTSKGLFRFAKNLFIKVQLGDNVNQNISCMIQGENGELWLGTYDGIVKYVGNTCINFGIESGLNNKYVHSLLMDKSGVLWVGTGNGLSKFDGQTFTECNSGLCNLYVGSIVLSPNGLLWLATDRCVSRFNGQVHYTINEYQGLSSNTIYLIQFDKSGNLWVGTNNGLDKLIINNDGKVISTRHYGKTEGFKGVECNTGAVCSDVSGNLWFGTIKGLIKYAPEFDEKNAIEPRTLITDIKLFQEKTNWNNYAKNTIPWFGLPINLVLPFYKNHLTFVYTGVSMKVPDKVLYTYKLEGFDKKWTPSTSNNEATYSNIPPGNYTFKVKAANEQGVWNKEPISFSFVITAPFWKTTWFFIFLIILFIFLIYLLVTYRTKQLLKQKQLLEEQVSQRVEEISKQNKEKEIMLREIHHRVKNNLQIINSLISLQCNFVKEEKSLALFDECRSRINSMALIHEKMYESKDIANINVKKYVQKLVKNLIQTYRINQNIKFDFDIKVTTFKIDIIVPMALMINEVVSNSLKYAYPNQGEGTLYLKLKTINTNQYELIIGDYGVGFPKGFIPEESDTLGLQLIEILAEQLGGTMSYKNENGLHYVFIFNQEEVKKGM